MPVDPQRVAQDAEGWARRFHDAYESLAPDFGYQTKPETKAFDAESPNGRLMIAVCARLVPAICAAHLDALAAGEGLDLKAIRARADAATPGPWNIVERFGISAPGYQGYEPNSWACLANVDDGESCCGDQDAAFIAAARTDVPALCDEVSALRAKLARLREDVQVLANKVALTVRERQDAEREREALRAKLATAEAAMREVCPEESEEEGVVFECCDENGDPQIQAATLAEAITQLNKWFGAFQRAAEKKEWRLVEENRGLRENITETNRLRIAAEARVKVGDAALAVGSALADVVDWQEVDTWTTAIGIEKRDALDSLLSLLKEMAP